jgi:hypothetical protein
MKKAALVTVCLLGVALLHGQTSSYQVERTFLSPDGSVTAAVAAQASVLGHGIRRFIRSERLATVQLPGIAAVAVFR